MVGALLGNQGVVAPRHQGNGIGVLLLDTDLLHHRLDRGQLVLSAEGHEHGTRADGGVEALGESALGANVQIGGELLHILSEAAADLFIIRLGFRGRDINVLFSTVTVQKFAGDIHDLRAVPRHGEAGIRLDDRYGAGVEVLFLRERHERVDVLGLDNDSHTLL